MKVIIFDFNRTIYDPDAEKMFDGVYSLLEKLSDDIQLKLVLLGKGDHERKKLVESLCIQKFFDQVIIKPEKYLSDFLKLKEDYPDADYIAIGDRVKKEIKYANQAGMKTIWFKNGKFADEVPLLEDEEPDDTISSILDLNI